MEIEELSQNIQRVIGILHQKHDENEAMKYELEKTRAENEALKSEIERLLDALRRHEYESRLAGAQYEDKPERMGRILPHDDKSRSVTPTPNPPVRGSGGGKKTSL